MTVSLTLTCPSYTVPIPFWGSMPSGPLVWSWGTGHTAGALSAHVTWQEKLHTAGETQTDRRFDWSNFKTSSVVLISKLTEHGSHPLLLVFLPSQVQPWRMRPTMRDVQRLHLVGVLNVFTTNWCALDYGEEVKWLLTACEVAKESNNDKWCERKTSHLWRGASNTAVPSWAHGGGLDWTGRVVY